MPRDGLNTQRERGGWGSEKELATRAAGTFCRVNLRSSGRRRRRACDGYGHRSNVGRDSQGNHRDVCGRCFCEL